jgi:hypothetical protein
MNQTEFYFDRKDRDFLRDEYAKVDWSRERTVTASQMQKLTALLDKLGGPEKVEKLLQTLAEEESKSVKRIRRRDGQDGAHTLKNKNLMFSE